MRKTVQSFHELLPTIPLHTAIEPIAMDQTQPRKLSPHQTMHEGLATSLQKPNYCTFVKSNLGKITSYPPQEWREVYVVIPTIWAVDIERQSTKRNVFKIDPSRSCIETHLITTSEWCALHLLHSIAMGIDESTSG